VDPGNHLVTSAYESAAAALVEERFTQRLIDILNGLSASQEIVVAQTHAKLVNKANQPASIVALNILQFIYDIASKDNPSITLGLRLLSKIPREFSQ
jgi:hypothetical protein